MTNEYDYLHQDVKALSSLYGDRQLKYLDVGLRWSRVGYNQKRYIRTEAEAVKIMLCTTFYKDALNRRFS